MLAVFNFCGSFDLILCYNDVILFKHGLFMPARGNQVDTGILQEADQLIREQKATSRYEALEILKKEAKIEQNTEKRKRIKTTEKALGFRKSRNQK